MKFKMKFRNPFMTTKRHRNRLAIEKHEIRQECRREHEKKEEELKKDLYQVVKNLTTLGITYQNDCGRPRWRLVLELDPRMMSMALERGNDQRMISHIADGIKHQVERELMSCNIQRPEDFDLGRKNIGYDRPSYQPVF